MSFTNWNGYSQTFRFIGLENYRTMISDPDVGRTIKNTCIYGLGSTFFQTLLGLSLAIFLEKQTRVNSFLRTLVYLPVIISPLIIGYIWYFFFRYSGGAMNDIVGLFGGEPVDWFANGPRAVWIITGINAYQFVGGVSMIIFLAGLQSIQREYYEAAVIDGAKESQKLVHITLPLLAPAFTSSITFNVIGGMKLFDVIVATTAGGARICISVSLDNDVCSVFLFPKRRLCCCTWQCDVVAYRFNHHSLVAILQIQGG